LFIVITCENVFVFSGLDDLALFHVRFLRSSSPVLEKLFLTYVKERHTYLSPHRQSRINFQQFLMQSMCQRKLERLKKT
jgi:hypothetical protein